MNFETRQNIIDAMAEWEDKIFEVFEKTERPNWDNAAETVKEMFCATVDDLLEEAKEEYGYFD